MKTQHFTPMKSSYLTNNTVCHFANCGPRPNCRPFRTFE